MDWDNIFWFLLVLNVIIFIYRAIWMPAFERENPDEYFNSGADHWFYEGLNFVKFCGYLLSGQYKKRIENIQIVKFLRNLGILYSINIVGMVYLVISIEMAG